MLSNLARMGSALGSPTRTAMISVLFDGASHSAGELARAAGVGSATASHHLSVLVDAGLLSVRPEGRTRLYRITDERIAHALEQLGEIEVEPPTSLRLSREQRRVRLARTCYDHLAGRLGVALTDWLRAKDWVTGDLGTVTPSGRSQLSEQLGLDLSNHGRRPLVRACLDWTEKQDHLAGALGARIADLALDREWVVRKAGSRALSITPWGHQTLAKLGVDLGSGQSQL